MMALTGTPGVLVEPHEPRHRLSREDEKEIARLRRELRVPQEAA
jgi:hypothetical protein